MGRLTPEAAAEAARICACLNVRRVARAVTRLYDEHLQACGLRSTQFVVLVGIQAHGSPALPALAEALGLERSVLTRSLTPLEREGLVRVVPSKAGGPSHVQLTAKGRRRLEKGVPLWQRAQGRFEERLGEGRWNDLLAQLKDIERAADR